MSQYYFQLPTCFDNTFDMYIVIKVVSTISYILECWLLL